MAKIAGSECVLDVLVNCKTYPAVSTKYLETVCTRGISRDGSFIRLYPVPFRFLEEKEQYNRWDVIRVRAHRDTKDTRLESWHLDVGAPIDVIDSVNSERHRWEWMHRGVFESAASMESMGRTNGLVEIIPEELYWEPEEKTWSPGQLALFKHGNLFHDESKMRSLSERVPWQFKLRLIEKNTGQKFDQKVLAWSYYQGFRNNFRENNDAQAALAEVRDRVHRSILDPQKAVFAIFGTHSRFKHWMISALYHVPRSICAESRLF